MRKVIAIGETVLDIIFKDDNPITAKPGGSSFNAIISIGRTGIPATFISETGNDKVGDLIIRFLKSNGINTEYVTRFHKGKSALALAFLNHDNDAEYQFYKDYPKQRLEAGFPEINHNDFVLFGSYFALNQALREQIKGLLDQANSKGAIVYYDPNFRDSHLQERDVLLSTIKENFNASSIIRGSDEDFFNIYNSRDIDFIYSATCKNKQPLIVTMNANGVIVKDSKNKYTFSSRRIETKSTIGAGDNFNAGIAFALFKYSIGREDLQKLDFETWGKIIEIAISFSSEVCQSYDNYISESFAAQLKRTPTT